MVCQRSRVIAVNVNTDSSLANTCMSHTNMYIDEFCNLLNYNIYCMQWTECIHTHRKEACSAATQPRLPVYGIVVVLSTSEHVYGCYDYQVDAHAEVSKGQVTHEEPRNSQLGAAAWQDISGKRKVMKMSLTGTNQAVMVPKIKMNNIKMSLVGVLMTVIKRNVQKV